jgi:hypothetical protein
MSKIKEYIEELRQRAERDYLQELNRLADDEAKYISEELGDEVEVVDPNLYQDNLEDR